MALKSSGARAQKRNKTKSLFKFKSRGHTGVCGQHLSEEFDIKTGVKQGCILSQFLFCLAIDVIVKRTDIGVKSGII